MTTLLIILVGTMLLFVWGRFSSDVVALLSMMLLFLSGILDLQETLSGFSNPTVVMIASLFVIGEGLSQTGWTAIAGRRLVEWAGRSASKLLVLLCSGAGLLSGFVSNTGTVATLLPIAVSAAWTSGTLPSKLLIPVAFSSNTGGLLTLTGTPPNIIVTNALAEGGYLSFAFFEFAYVGVPLLLIAVLYFRYIAQRLLPAHTSEHRPVHLDSAVSDWVQHYSMGEDMYRLRIRSMSQLQDTAIGDWGFEEEDGVSIVRLKRRHPNRIKGISRYVEFPDQDTELRYHDVIFVKGDAEQVDRFAMKYHLGLLPFMKEEAGIKQAFMNQEVGMAELIVTPNSILLGREVPMGQYIEQAGIQLLAASRDNRPLLDQNIVIRAGDAFIIRGTWERIGALKQRYKNIVITGSPDHMSTHIDTLTYKSYIALGALVMMLALLVFDVVPGAIAAMLSAGMLLITRCVPIAKAYKGISWTSVIMIAAMIPMGVALQKTGAASAAAKGLVATLGQLHPMALLAGVFVLTSACSQAMNNSATAVLMAPIAIQAATALGLSPAPFMMVVAISASTAFLTPVGTTTNAMVLFSGGYRFIDYMRVGAPLLLLFLVVSLLLVPMIWSF